MKHHLIALAAAALLAGGISAAAAVFADECKPDDKACAPMQEKAEVYRCPMHPEVVSDKPGRCPKCRMFLEKDTSSKTPEMGATTAPTPKS